MSGAEVLDHLVGVGGAVWRASWQASVLALLVVAVQLILGKRISAGWRHAMWLLVLVRLALPVVPSSPLSVFNLASAVIAPVRETRDAEPAIHVMAAPATAVPPLAASRTNTPSSAKPRAAHVAPPAPNLWSGWPQVLASVWLAGACALALRIAWATLRVSRMMRRLDPVDDESTQSVLRATANELNVRTLPKLLAGDGLFSPALVGFIRPKLLVPRDLLARFDACELRLIFLHELAHLKRRDVAINWAATLLTVLHWMNPFVWLVAWRLRLERELACDELVLSLTSDADRRAYGHTIVKLLETFSRHAKPLPGGVGILEGKEQMTRRIIMIAQFANNGRTWTVAAAMLVLALGLVALTDAVQAEAPAPTPAPAPTTQAVRPLRQDVIVTPDGGRVTINRNTRDAEERAELQDLEARRAAAQLGDAHPETKALDDQIKTAQARLAASAAHDAKEAARTQLRPGDLVTVSVMNLMGSGVETMKTSRVDADGKISLPYVGQVNADGLKPNQLEEAIAKAYQAKGVMRDAVVAVSLPERGESHQLAGRAQATPGMVTTEAIPGWTPTDSSIPSDPLAAPAIDAAMKAALDRQLPEVKFDGIPLSDVIDFLREVTKSNIFVNWRAVEAAGIDRSAPVSLNVRDVAFKDALALVLKGQGGGLQYGIENGVITIDVPHAVEKAPKQITKAYDVRDLIQAGQASGLFGGEVGNPPINELTRTIYETVAPDSWRAQGGNGSLSAYGNKLIVTANEDVHRELVSLLDMLRDKPATQPATH